MDAEKIANELQKEMVLNRHLPNVRERNVDLISKALTEAKAEGRREMNEEAAKLVNGETCSDEEQCECFSCPMLNKMAQAIRGKL